MSIEVSVCSSPFNAKGDGKSNDRAAIQAAIDSIYKNGGGTVTLDAGRTFLSSGIILRSGINLHFGDGAVLQQTPFASDFVKPSPSGGYVPYTPLPGHNFDENIKWSHYWYKNYPFIFAPAGTVNFKITGSGTVRMADVENTQNLIKLCPVGFYRCKDFEISDITITNYHSYAMMPFTSENGLIKNVKINNWSHGNGDGICLMNCRNIRITGCEMFTGDDSVYIFSSCRNPRKSEWWNSDTPQPSENIEIDHNNLKSNHCKAFGMILWGLNCEDHERVEVRNVYVHDNHIETLGNWLWNPYTDKAGFPPVTDVRFENNVIDGIEENFFDTQISDMTGFPSMRRMLNGSFEDGRCFWNMKKNHSENSAGVHREDGSSYGYINNLSLGDAAIFQGCYIEAGKPCLFKAEVMSSGGKCRMFVRNSASGETVASLDFSNTDWCEKLIEFTAPQSGNYRLGIERGKADSGYARIRRTALGSHENAADYQKVISDNGKIIYKYNDNLFRR